MERVHLGCGTDPGNHNGAERGSEDPHNYTFCHEKRKMDRIEGGNWTFKHRIGQIGRLFRGTDEIKRLNRTEMYRVRGHTSGMETPAEGCRR